MLAPMRDIAETLEQLGLSWYITGSEALAAYGTPRQTMDVDVVVDTTADVLDVLADRLAHGYYYTEVLRFGNRQMASLIDRAGAGKVDLIIRDPDAWGRSAMEGRRRWEHPTWGAVWVSRLEDLILAKLEWSEGTSELQLRDVGTLLRMNERAIDHEYLSHWARALGVEDVLRAVPRGHVDAP